MTVKTIAHAEPFAVLVEDSDSATVIVTAGAQGPPGKNGIGGADISDEPDNQLEAKSNGLYVPPLNWSTKQW